MTVIDLDAFDEEDVAHPDRDPIDANWIRILSRWRRRRADGEEVEPVATPEPGELS